MTQNQINLAQHRENVRHNLEMERENARHNMAEEGIKSETLAESTRHNIASESISQFSANEQKRHNVSGEGITASYNQSYMNEMYRHNLANETLQGSSINVERYKAAVSGKQVGVSASLAAESARHNLISEYQNAQILGESKRHNERTEQISTLQNQRGFTVQMANVNENIRHNMAVENVQSNTQKETGRHNYAMEVLQQQNVSEGIRHNVTTEAEIKRHNVVTEIKDFINVLSNAASTASKFTRLSGLAQTK